MARTQRILLAWLEREVLACRPIALRYFRSDRLAVERKPDRSPVTAADRAIEERLRRAIARACPGERIIGEEYGETGRGTTYWTIDPIDGTRAFTRGLPSFGIMVGRVERGRPTLGLVHFPALNITVATAPGVPAYEEAAGRRVVLPRARAVRRLAEATVFHGGARWWASTRYARGFARLIKACFLERAYGDCYGYLWGLRGGVDAVLDYGVKPWDLVPLAALARATGRTLTDFHDRFSFSGPETVMAHPAVARQVTRILRSKA